MCEKHNLLLVSGIMSRPAYQNTPTKPNPAKKQSTLISSALRSHATLQMRNDGETAPCWSVSLLQEGGGGVLESVEQLLWCWSHDKQIEINKGLRQTCRLLDSGRKLEFPEKNPHRLARKIQSRHKKTTNPETSSDAKHPISRQWQLSVAVEFKTSDLFLLLSSKGPKLNPDKWSQLFFS